MNAFILGAGASKAYSDSPSGLRMPLATEVFKTVHNLEDVHQPWVLTGNILNYARKKWGVSILEVFSNNYDIEAFHSEIEADLLAAIEKDIQTKEGISIETLLLQNTFNQLSSVFCFVLNSIANGPVSKAHNHFVSLIDSGDALITFNWDTLLDRSLFEAGSWSPESGYGFDPKEVFRDGWHATTGRTSEVKLIKLHGSTNWLTAYQEIDPETGALSLMQDSPPETVRIFQNASKPYDTYDGRYMGPYVPFTMGYYPPHLSHESYTSETGWTTLRQTVRIPYIPRGKTNDIGLLSAPLIIPPVRYKQYRSFGSLFSLLWDAAQNALSEADRIYLIGYSFPVTDEPTKILFRKSFCSRSTFPTIVIVNPNPEPVAKLMIEEMGIPARFVEIRKAAFDDSFIL